MATVEPNRREIALLSFQAGYPATNRAADSADWVALKQRDAFVCGFLAGASSGHSLGGLLASHIDHDEPPGLAARELARAALALLDGCRNNGSTAFRLRRDLLDLAERYAKEGSGG